MFVFKLPQDCFTLLLQDSNVATLLIFYAIVYVHILCNQLFSCYFWSVDRKWLTSCNSLWLLLCFWTLYFKRWRVGLGKLGVCIFQLWMANLSNTAQYYEKMHWLRDGEYFRILTEIAALKSLKYFLIIIILQPWKLESHY